GRRTANLLVTGRCVSASFEAQAAIRTTPTVGALGQAAGTAAAMAAAADGDVGAVDIPRLQRTLVSQGAYLEI
ncbi:MAG TPA: FAD-dependent oxidoreductase, partial [Akkermansia sp.]|nr:FAD-dependent oxidoreductase [Akkermansia sp.]